MRLREDKKMRIMYDDDRIEVEIAIDESKMSREEVNTLIKQLLILITPESTPLDGTRSYEL